ncbi:MAG: Na+ dependent nucleoside transporter, partial [Bacteroidetes bacterium]
MKKSFVSALLFSILTLSLHAAIQTEPQQNDTNQHKTLIENTASGTSASDQNKLSGKEDLLIDSSGQVLPNTNKTGFSPATILRGILGMFVLILIAFLFSSNRKAIAWRVVIYGLLIQVTLAVSILYIPIVRKSFEFAGKLFVLVLDFTRAGSVFLFGSLLDTDKMGMIFAFQILPTIIFFSALTSLFFYLGIIQKIVYALAWLMTKVLKLSGAESLSVAGNIFLGQTESPLMIKAYLPTMNRSEILLVMAGGMATLAG